MEPNTNEFVKALLAASWQGSLVIVLILLLRPLLGWRVPARWRSLLWSLALLRLLVPAFLLPPSPASLQNLATVDRPLEEAGRAFVRFEAAPGSARPLERLRSQGPGEGEAPAPTPAPRPWWQVATAVWMTGCALTALWILAGTIRLHRRLRRDAGEVDPPIRAVWERCCASVFWSAAGSVSATPLSEVLPAGSASAPHPRNVPKAVSRLRLPPHSKAPRLVQTDAVGSPALVGIWRPVLLIPSAGGGTLSPEDWEHIFLHELAHFRRRDLWLHALQLVALCAHWFNPLVWLGFRYLRADRELAADEWALRHLANDRGAVAYGDTLLKILSAQTPRGLTPGLVGILEDGAQMRQRLRHIVAFTPRRLAGSIAGIAVVLALAAAVLGRQAADLAAYEGLAPAESLIVAARRGEREAVEQLLHDGADVNTIVKMRGERTALTEAVAAHDLELIRLLVAKGANVQLKPGSGSAPLIVALKKGWSDIADYLREKGAICDAEILAAASNDAAAVEKYLASSELSYDKVKLLAEAAAAHGHRALFATLWDALKQLPEQRDYFPFSRDTLAIAVSNGHREVLEEIMKRDPNLTPHEGVVRLAAAAQRVSGMREWLASKGMKVPEYNDGERLIDAAEREDLPAIRRLLDAGVDIHFRGEADWTPLTKAATWGCPRAVKLLLERGADPNGRRYNNYSTLELAANPEVAGLLFTAGAKVTPKDIGYCVGHGSKEMVQWFLDHGVDPLKFADDDGSQPTLLFRAQKPEIAELLIARGVDLKVKNKFGSTALTWALQMSPQPAKVVEVLLKHGADPNARSEGGITPLMTAKDGASIDVLVAAGADLHATDDRGNGVLYSGWGAAIPSRIEALRRHGLKLDPAKGASLLVSAIVLRRDLAAVKKLLAMGIDPNGQDTWEGRATGTPLSAAIGNGYFEIAAVLRAAGARDIGELSEAAAAGNLPRITALLDSGADVNEKSANGETPLHFAAREGQSAAAALLLDRGANVNLFTATGYTARALAQMIRGQVEYQNYSPIHRLKPPEAKIAMDEILAAIRARKPDPNFRNEAGETALICGAGIGSVMVDLSEGVAINAQRPDGMAALMIAIASQPQHAPKEGPGSVGTDVVNGEATRWMSARAHFVKTLLAKGADLSLRNQAGKTALDLARENGNLEILELFQRKNP